MSHQTSRRTTPSSSSSLPASGFPLDGVHSIRSYVDRMVRHDDDSSTGQGQGTSGTTSMKALLLDSVTTQIVSTVYSQTEILKNHVYLVQRIDRDSDNHQQHQQQQQNHLTAIVFVRPVPSVVDRVARELEDPRFESYRLYFSGMLPTGLLRKLAEADVKERVRMVREVYADYLPINPDLVTLQCGLTSVAMTVAAGTSWAPKYAGEYERHLQGLQSLLLSLRRQPRVVRFAASSPCAEELARDIYDCLGEDAFQFHHPGAASSTTSYGGSGSGGGSTSVAVPGSGSNPLLLILDRRDDPVTPLLSQWTYQAMVHELLGLNNGRVNLKGAPGVPPDLQQVTLQDDFFVAHRNKNFGELGDEIQRLLGDYQRQMAASSSQSFATIEEMQQFMDKFPELRSRSHVVSKHVAIMGELARLVQVCSLMDVSQLEQELAVSEDHASHWRELLAKLENPNIKIPDKLRLGLLYALRYESSGNLHVLQSAMSRGGVPPDLVELVPVLLRYGGRQSRGPGLFQTNLMAKMTRSFISSVQGVDNVYTQHVPLLMETLQAAARGKLSAKTHPFLVVNNNNGSAAAVAAAAAAAESIPSEILVFMVGGVTYEEATKVSEWNGLPRKSSSSGSSASAGFSAASSSSASIAAGSPGGTATNNNAIPVLLGGSTIHNSTSFLEELKRTAL